jgi:hypothetical protein
MKNFICAVGLLGIAGLTWANVPTKTKPQPVNVAKRVSKAAAAVPANVAAVPEPELSAEHLALAQRVVTGKVPCELGAHVAITAHHAVPGKFVLEHGRQKFHMVPVVTATGAIRLEDAAGGAVWLQLGNKSMLMDQKQGRRLADVCMNADQVLVAQALEKTPAASILDPVEPSAATASAVVSANK